jgi:regulator of nucleoside diphosphate kinase
VYVAESQYNDLFAFAATSTAAGAPLLREELARAVLVADDGDPGAFVRLGSTVRYRDLISGRERTVRIVPPALGDIEQNRLSVLTPAGAALVGLAEGARLRWAGENDRPRAVEVLEVTS